MSHQIKAEDEALAYYLQPGQESSRSLSQHSLTLALYDPMGCDQTGLLTHLSSQ